MNDAYLKMIHILEKLDNNFSYHKPIGNQAERYVQIRDIRKRISYPFRNTLSNQS